MRLSSGQRVDKIRSKGVSGVIVVDNGVRRDLYWDET